MWYPTHEYQHDQPSLLPPPGPTEIEEETVLFRKKKKKKKQQKGSAHSGQVNPYQPGVEVPRQRGREPPVGGTHRPGAPTGRWERSNVQRQEHHKKMTFAEEIIRLDPRQILHDKRDLQAQVPIAPPGL